jgi:hypothetical protein
VEETNEWADEDTLTWVIGRALQEEEPLPGIEALLRRIGSRCGEPQVGGKRAVFSVGEHWVLKVPLTWEGDIDNVNEARYYAQTVASETDEFIPVANCRVHHSLPSGVALLWMERVVPVTFKYGDPSCPDWVGWVDCGQVGYTADGHLVAYDL